MGDHQRGVHMAKGLIDILLGGIFDDEWKGKRAELIGCLSLCTVERVGG